MFTFCIRKIAVLLRTLKERTYISTRHSRDIQLIITLLLLKMTLLWNRSWLPFLCCMCCPCNRQPFPHPAQHPPSTSYGLWSCSTSTILMSQWHHDSPVCQSQKLRVILHPVWVLIQLSNKFAYFCDSHIALLWFCMQNTMKIQMQNTMKRHIYVFLFPILEVWDHVLSIFTSTRALHLARHVLGNTWKCLWNKWM